MLKPSLCNYGNAFIPIKGTVTVAGALAAEKIILENYELLRYCLSEINNRQVDDANGVNTLTKLYIFLEYCENYSEAQGNVWYYCRDEFALNN